MATRCLNCIVAILIFAVFQELNAALPPLSAKERQRFARMVVTARVDDLDVRVRNRSRDSDWVVHIKAKVENVEKGQPEDIVPELDITCWHIRSRSNGWAGPTGHYDIPAKSARFRMWLRMDDNGNWTPLEPNGIELLDGHSRLNFKKTDQISKPIPQPVPEADEAYTTKGGLKFERLKNDWYVGGRNKSENKFVEVRRDLTSIEVHNDWTGERYLIPRASQTLKKANERYEMEIVDQISRTIPPTTKGEPTLEVFRSVRPAINPQSAPKVPPIPEDPTRVEQAVAFVRMGKLWEKIDLESSRLDARYLQEYRDDEVIQLKAIIEHEWQKPHTLTIVLSEAGGDVVLRNWDDEFRRVPLERLNPSDDLQ